MGVYRSCDCLAFALVLPVEFCAKFASESSPEVLWYKQINILSNIEIQNVASKTRISNKHNSLQRKSSLEARARSQKKSHKARFSRKQWMIDAKDLFQSK